jgi:hypothetical protein
MDIVKVHSGYRADLRDRLRHMLYLSGTRNVGESLIPLRASNWHLPVYRLAVKPRALGLSVRDSIQLRAASNLGALLKL